MNESSMAEKVTGIHGLVDHGEDGEEVKTTPRSSLGWLLQMVMSVRRERQRRNKRDRNAKWRTKSENRLGIQIDLLFRLLKTFDDSTPIAP